MMNISSISNAISPLGLNNNEQKINNDTSFQNMLSDAIGEVNKEQVEGYKAMEGIATGKVTNLQEAVQQIEEAELSMKLALETKNKAVSAYKQIMNMQI
ncbi:flagellar hook-basal body complex protein FliE [Poseidonibacter sp. 1_MG-2023]|uniref:flagellar hook-basal body complex protein FliE n=1 Tax=Poseidonibacter TaxID=2321187 RepID=UPI001E283043|nr:MULTISPECIES: flagellar hook-basal body complex protein FliE [Poseidonibacter]MDO6828818.1 flagellar hook-basal body complex protein FliE [Poseidonibacter sp. 1_MG-2023]